VLFIYLARININQIRSRK